MKKTRLLLVSNIFLMFCISLKAQSLFDDYGISSTNLQSAPYTNIDLDASDFNPAGNVFLRNGFELSLSSLWPRLQIIENKNTFKARTFEVERQCIDQSKLGVPNPSIRISYRYDKNAYSFSYVHGESQITGDGNTCFDEAVQKTISPLIDGLNSISNYLFDDNQYAYYFSLIDGVDVPPPYNYDKVFPLTMMSKSSQYDCISDKFCVGYSRLVDIGKDKEWKYLSIYYGLRAQRMETFSKTGISIFVIDKDDNNCYPLTELFDKYRRFYNQIADSIGNDISNYYNTMAESYDALGQYVDTAFNNLGSHNRYYGWGLNGVIGINLVSPYWNLSAKIESGWLPYRFSVGWSHYYGSWQLNAGFDVGYASAKYGLYSCLFGQENEGFNYDRFFGNIGVEAAWSIPDTYWTLRGGVSCGINKDLLLYNGYDTYLAKYNSLSPSLGFQWKASSILIVSGGAKASFPLKKEFNLEGAFGGTNVVHPEYQFLIGIITHLE